MKVKNVDIIKHHEGLVLKAYLPTKDDVWTIGYGHTQGVSPGMVITEKQAEVFLYMDLKWVEDCLNSQVKVRLSQNQFDALASLVFNIGATNFSKSTVLRELNKGNYKTASEAFLMWNKQRSKLGTMVVLPGLTKRRLAEKELFNE